MHTIMKRIHYTPGMLAIAILFPFMLNAQQSTFFKANTYYATMSYAEAIPLYSRVLKRDSVNEALLKIAECYRLTNDIKNTEKTYALIIKKGIGKPIHQLYYAQALMSTGQYEAALTNMAAYRADERGETFVNAITHLQKFFKDSAYYEIKKEAFNSKQNDFSPVLWNDHIIFTSSRVRSSLVNYEYLWSQNSFFKVYMVGKNPDGEYTSVQRFNPGIQKKFNDGPVCFNRDYSNLYFTRNNVNVGIAERATDGTVKLQLYRANLNIKGDSYQYPSAFEFNNKEYNYAHPSINAEGTRLYFSSDMPGGEGGMDLWVCAKEGDSWSAPTHLGDLVNTKGSEIFPCVFGNKLYFSSNGLEGIGGLDLFVVTLDANGMPMGNPSNLGVPMNSPADDFGIAWKDGGKSGFLSSNRESLSLDDDIYSFVVNMPTKQTFRLQVMDSLTSSLLNSNVTLIDDETGEKLVLSSDKGTYEVELFPNHSFSIECSASDYLQKSNLIYSPSIATDPFEIRLAKKKVLSFSGLVMEKGGLQTAVDSALVVITNKQGEKVCERYYTASDGKYIPCVLNPNEKYTVTASKQGYFTSLITFDELPTNGQLKTIYLEKIEIGKAIKIENIYFDYDKSDITPKAAVELDKVVKLLQENPDIIIELGSHTDCRGSATYNLSLSDRRAKSSAAYIVSKGIDPSRITGKGYGESQLLNGCQCEGAVKSACPDAEHQMNRRTEFKVTGFINGVGNATLKSNPH